MRHIKFAETESAILIRTAADVTLAFVMRLRNLVAIDKVFRTSGPAGCSVRLSKEALWPSV